MTAPGPGTPATQACQITPGCARGNHTADQHPCGGPFHVAGSPCTYCGKPTPATGGPCPDCWSPITIADFKAIAAEAGKDAHVTRSEDL